MKINLSVLAILLAAGTLSTAAPITYVTTLSGANENPPTGSAGTGSVTVIFDLVAHTLSVQAAFSGLGSGTAAAHIHCCTSAPLTGDAGVATQTPSFVGFPLGVTSGTFNNTLDTSLASTYNPAFVAANGGSVSAAETAFAAGLAAGETYFNIHTTNFPTGEIRGYLQVPTSAVPEPATLTFVGLVLLGLCAGRRYTTHP